MRTSDKNRLGIKETIEEWRDSIFQYPILNRIWQLLPGFILWKIWKEKNHRIFKSSSLSWQNVWDKIHSNIKETINLDPYLRMSPGTGYLAYRNLWGNLSVYSSFGEAMYSRQYVAKATCYHFLHFHFLIVSIYLPPRKEFVCAAICISLPHKWKRKYCTLPPILATKGVSSNEG
jgi:hypothetical protein